MFVLDTNVVSELMRPVPHPVIASWVAERATSNLFLTAVTEAELRFGLAVMPLGKRRDGLAKGLERMLETGLCESRPAVRQWRGARLCRDRRRTAADGSADHTSRLSNRGHCPAHAVWRWQRATFGTSRTWESTYSTPSFALPVPTIDWLSSLFLVVFGLLKYVENLREVQHDSSVDCESV